MNTLQDKEDSMSEKFKFIIGRGRKIYMPEVADGFDEVETELELKITNGSSVTVHYEKAHCLLSSFQAFIDVNGMSNVENAEEKKVIYLEVAGDIAMACSFIRTDPVYSQKDKPYLSFCKSPSRAIDSLINAIRKEFFIQRGIKALTNFIDWDS